MLIKNVIISADKESTGNSFVRVPFIAIVLLVSIESLLDVEAHSHLSSSFVDDEHFMADNDFFVVDDDAKFSDLR